MQIEVWLSAIHIAASNPECSRYRIPISKSDSVENIAFIQKAIELLKAKGYQLHEESNQIVVRWDLPWYKRLKKWLQGNKDNK